MENIPSSQKLKDSQISRNKLNSSKSQVDKENVENPGKKLSETARLLRQTNLSNIENDDEIQFNPDMDVPDQISSNENVTNSDLKNTLNNTLYNSKKRKAAYYVFLTFSLFILFSGILLIIVLMIVIGGAPPRISLPCGTIVGVYSISYRFYIFEGIPYAKPPIENLRYQQPHLLTNNCWSGDFMATKRSHKCIQSKLYNDDENSSEDCLYIDIYSYDYNPTTPAPVIVYFHGGFFRFGSINDRGISPNKEFFSTLKKTVLVNVQYRLNVPGFMHLKNMPESNLGVQDMIASLKWVKSNIQYFGGNSNKITILASDSSASALWALTTSKSSKGLFHGIWSMSSCPLFFQTRKQAEILYKNVLGEDCTSFDCIKKLDVNLVLKKFNQYWNLNKTIMSFPKMEDVSYPLMVIDDKLFKKSPFLILEDVIQHGTNSTIYSDVPIVFGSTAQELDMAPAAGSLLKGNVSIIIKILKDIFDKVDPYNELINITLENYKEEAKNAENFYTTIASDIRVNCPLNNLAELTAKSFKSPIYRYIIKERPSSGVTMFSFKSIFSFHFWDLMAMVKGYETFIKESSNSNIEFGNIIGENFQYFVNNGKLPPEWKVFPNVTAIFSSQIEYDTTIYNEKQCQIWNNYSNYQKISTWQP